MEIKTQDISNYDKRLDITFSNGITKLRISGYDELPHLIEGDGYKRISWREFRKLVTSPDMK